METNTRFKKKYLKYKSKYLNIKKLIGGSFGSPVQGTHSPVQGTLINHFMKVSPDQTPFKPSEKIGECTSKIPIRCLKDYTVQVISKIIRTENEGNAFIADVIHDMETSGRKQKIINGSFGDYVSSSIPGIYNSKSYFDKLLIGNYPELLSAHNNAFFHSRKPKKNDDETYREDHENNLSFAQNEYKTLTPEELNSNYSDVDIKNNIVHIPPPASPHQTTPYIMSDVFYNKIIEKFSDNKLDVEAENSAFSIPKLFTDPSIIDTGLYLKCEPMISAPEHIKNDIVMIDQGSNSSSLTSKDFNAIDGKDFILDGLKPFIIDNVLKNLSTNISTNQVIKQIIDDIEEPDQVKKSKKLKELFEELFEHITDSYFKHIFSILNLRERLNLRDSKIKIINGLWFLNFWLGEKNYLIDITNRGITRHTYNLSSLVISEYENNGDPLEWIYLKDIRDDYNILYDNLVLFCNIVCLTAKAFGDASYKIFTYLITIFEKYHIKPDGNPTIVTQDRQLLYDLVKTSIIGLDRGALLPNIYYKLKSKKKKEGLIIATNTSSLPEYDFEYVKISLDYINNFISVHGESTNELFNSGSFNNYIVLLILKLCFINEKKFIDLIEKYISDTPNLKIFEKIPIVFILSKVHKFDEKATVLLLNELENKHDFLKDVINFRFIFNKNRFDYDNFFKNIEILFNKFKKGKFLFKIKDILDLTPTYYSFENIYQYSFTPNKDKSNLLIFIYEQPVHNFDNIQSISDQITGDESINYLDAYLNILPRIGLVQDEIPNIVDYFLENIYLAQIKDDEEKELYDDLKETNIYVWRVFLINLILFDNNRAWGSRSSKIETLYRILRFFITSYNSTISQRHTDPEINLLNINLVVNEENIYIDNELEIEMHAELYYSNIYRRGVSNRRPTPAVSVTAGQLINKILVSKEPLIKGFIRIISNIKLPTPREVAFEAPSEATRPKLKEGDYEPVYNCLIEKYINIEDKTLLEFKLKFMPTIIYTEIMKKKPQINNFRRQLFLERVGEPLPNEAWFKARYQQKNDKGLLINDIVDLIINWIVLFSPDHNEGVTNENEFILCLKTRK